MKQLRRPLRARFELERVAVRAAGRGQRGECVGRDAAEPRGARRGLRMQRARRVWPLRVVMVEQQWCVVGLVCMKGSVGLLGEYTASERAS